MEAVKRNSIVEVWQWKGDWEEITKCRWLCELASKKRIEFDTYAYDCNKRPMYMLIVWNFGQSQSQKGASPGDWLIYSDGFVWVMTDAEFTQEYKVISKEER